MKNATCTRLVLAVWLVMAVGGTGCVSEQGSPISNDATARALVGSYDADAALDLVAENQYGESDTTNTVDAPVAFANNHNRPTTANAEWWVQNGCVAKYGTARWGADDEAGMSNTQTPEIMMEAITKFVRSQSPRYSLAQVSKNGMPSLGDAFNGLLAFLGFPTLVGYNFAIPPDGTHAFDPTSSNFLKAHPSVLFGGSIPFEEVINAELHEGTYGEAPSHLCYQSVPGGLPESAAHCYGNRTVADMYDPNHPELGMKHADITKVKPFFTTAEIIDVAAANGAPLGLETCTIASACGNTAGCECDLASGLSCSVGYFQTSCNAGQPVTLDLLMQAIDAEGLDIGDIADGSAVAIYTGWGDNFDVAGFPYEHGANPGLSLKAAQFLACRGVALIIDDAPTFQVSPATPADKALATSLGLSTGLPTLDFLLRIAGVTPVHNGNLGAAVAAIQQQDHPKYLGAISYTPVPLKGATASWGAPILYLKKDH